MILIFSFTLYRYIYYDTQIVIRREDWPSGLNLGSRTYLYYRTYLKRCSVMSLAILHSLFCRSTTGFDPRFRQFESFFVCGKLVMIFNFMSPYGNLLLMWIIKLRRIVINCFGYRVN